MNNTGIRLEVEQVTDAKELTFKVIKVKALRADELPHEYLRGDDPVVYQATDGVLRTNAFRLVWVRTGTFLLLSELQSLVTYIRAAGDHLTRVNKKLKKKQLEQKTRIIFVDGREVKKTQQDEAAAANIGSVEMIKYLHSLGGFEKPAALCTNTELKMRCEYARVLKAYWEKRI